MAGIGVLGAALCSPGAATTADDLKGYSVEVTSNSTVVWRDINPRVTPVRQNFKLYIGLAGNIFTYSDQAAGRYVERGSAVAGEGAAKTIQRGRMIAWTFDGGNLTMPVREIEGFIVFMIIVDPSRSTCSFAKRAQADSTTGRVVIQRPDGLTGEVVSDTMNSSTCTIKKGNVFSTDQ